jgi:hypothetical protein
VEKENLMRNADGNILSGKGEKLISSEEKSKLSFLFQLSPHPKKFPFAF